MKPGQAGIATTYTVAFDCFEADPLGNPTELPAYGPQINPVGLEGQRYYFGPGYKNCFATNDMRVATGSAGTNATRVDLAWFWEGAAGEDCILIVNTAEDFGATSAGPDFSNPYDGVAYDFGTTLTPGSFYISRVDLTGTLVHKMPNDGNGAYSLVIANANGTSGFTEASLGQPMLWVTKVNNPSFQGINQWDDDNPANGVHDAPAEFYDYTWTGTTNPPLGAMIAFYRPVTSETVAPTSYQIFRGQLISGTVASLATSDDSYLVVQKGLTLNAAESPVDVNVTGTTTITTPTTLAFTLETKANTPNIQQTTSLFNVTTNAWEQVDQRNIGVADVSNTFTISNNPARFVAANGTVRARMQYKAVGLVTSSAFRVSFDQSIWTITP